MAETAVELRAEIEQTRRQMSQTLEELSVRVEETRRRYSLAERVRQRPLAVAASVAATGLLLGLLRGRRR